MVSFEYKPSSKQTFSRSSNQQFSSRGVQKKVEKPSYENGVPVARDVETGEIIKIPTNGTTRVFICAQSGEKKTILGKAYLSRVQDMGGFIFAGTDIKNDFSSWNGVQGPSTGASKSLQDATCGLLKGENGLDMSRTLAIPRYLVDKYGPNDPNPRNIGTIFSIGFGDLSEQDFKFIIDFENWRSGTQQDILEDILLDAEDKDLTWSYIFDRLEDEGKSGEKIKKRLRKYKKKGIVSSTGESVDSILNFEDVGLVSLGLVGVDNYKLGSEKTIRFTSAIFHRKLLDKRQRGVAGLGDKSVPLVIFDDECHEVFPSGESSPAKDEMDLVFSRRGRQAGVVTLLSTQQPQKVPSPQDTSEHDFISHTSHAFVGRGLNWKGYRTVFQAFRFYDSNDTQPLRNAKDRLEDGQFLFMDNSMDSVGDLRVVEPLSPLTSHPEGDKN